MEEPKCSNHKTHEFRLTSGERDIEELKEGAHQTQELLIRLVALQENYARADLDKEDRLRALELCSGKKWDSAMKVILGCVVSLIIGYLAKGIL